MKTPASRHLVDHKMLRKFALLVFVGILVFHGTYFRSRPMAAVPTLDWLVLARLLVCGIGFMAGIILVAKNMPLGFGAKMLLLYAAAAGLSAVTSPYPTTVVGYSILLFGATVLMIGLTYSARNLAELVTIEKVWFWTIAVLIVKDTVTSLIFPQMAPPGEVVRIGMGVTHANQLSILSALIFWLSFRPGRTKRALLLWPLRALLIYVIIGARSRVSATAFLLGGLVYLLFASRDHVKRWVTVSAGVGALSTFFLLNLCFNQGWATDIVEYARRGQKRAALTTFTGRSLIWQHALDKSLETPITGHGYAVSRLTIGKPPNVDWGVAHCHNELLEIFFNTGILGLIPALAIFTYSLGWTVRFSALRRAFSTDMALHAACGIVICLFSCLFESRLGGRLLPPQQLFFFYLLVLDRKKDFVQQFCRPMKSVSRESSRARAP
jgi:O-antigen ligase